jgi:hypothetical protein
MKPIPWAGIILVALGIASLFIAIPNRERNGVSVGGVSFEIKTRHDEKVSPFVSAVLILGGARLMVVGRRK